MTQQEMDRVIRTVKRKYKIFANIALYKVPIIEDKNIETAAVCGEKNNKGKIDIKGIKYNPDFMDSLSFEQQVFVMAHETCHIAFKHFIRCLDKPEKDITRKYKEYCEKETDERLRKIELLRLKKRYYNIWNIATDACINAFLKKDGLEMPEGVIDKRTGKPMEFVNIADGLYRSAERIYDALVTKEEEKNNVQQNNSQNSDRQDNDTQIDNMDSSESTKKTSPDNQVDSGLNDIDVDNYKGFDSHDEWAKEPEKEKNPKTSKTFMGKIKGFLGKNNKKSDNSEEIAPNNNDEEVILDDIPTDEASVFRENEKANQKKENINEALSNITKSFGLQDIKPVKSIISWKQLLMLSVEEEIERWGYRRANSFSTNARLEDEICDERANTEIILDSSGSISDKLLRAFLRQLVPLFKDSDIKAGCFTEKFHGFTELRSIEQIEKFKVIRDNGGTNFEAAVTAFTKESGKRINKIVFTDGELDGISSHIQKTRADDVIWIVCGNNMNFKPVGGRVIKVSKNDLNEMLSFTNNDENDLFDSKTSRLRR